VVVAAVTVTVAIDGVGAVGTFASPPPHALSQAARAAAISSVDWRRTSDMSRVPGKSMIATRDDYLL
jgi:hypothetical protein